MKVRVCDVCKKNGIMTETNRRLCFRGQSHLNIDVCDTHRMAFKGLTFDEAKTKLKLLLGDK